MYKKIIGICFFAVMYYGNAQIVINLPTLHLSLQDILSQSAYDNINASNVILDTQEAGNKASIALLTPIFNEQLQELTTYNPLFEAQETVLKNFVSGSSFNSTRGYNSYGYIQEKYPLNPLHATDVLKNTVIRLRYKIKLNAERDRISDYLNFANPIPEGERVLLLLTTLENVINLTLENEKY